MKELFIVTAILILTSACREKRSFKQVRSEYLVIYNSADSHRIRTYERVYDKNDSLVSEKYYGESELASDKPIYIKERKFNNSRLESEVTRYFRPESMTTSSFWYEQDKVVEIRNGDSLIYYYDSLKRLKRFTNNSANSRTTTYYSYVNEKVADISVYKNGKLIRSTESKCSGDSCLTLFLDSAGRVQDGMLRIFAKGVLKMKFSNATEYGLKPVEPIDLRTGVYSDKYIYEYYNSRLHKILHFYGNRKMSQTIIE